MASLLDLNLDEILGTKNPVKGLINDPNYETKLNIDTALGLGQGYYNSLYKGYSTPKKILNALTAAKAGRQSGIDTFTKNYMTQQDILDKTLGIKKKEFDILKAPLEIDKLNYDLVDMSNKNFLSSIKVQSIKDKFLKLQERANNGDKSAEKQLLQFAGNPDEFYKLEQSRDINNREYEEPELNAARLLQLDVTKRNEWSPEQEYNFNAIISAPSVKEAAEENRARMAAHKEDPQRVPYNPVPSRNDIINYYIKNGTVPQSSAASKNTLEVMSTGQTDKGFRGADGRIYTPEKWNKLGIEFQNLYDSDKTRTEIEEGRKLITTNMRTDADSAQYGFYNGERTNQALERILDNPEKFEKLFSTFGGRLPIAINKTTGAFIATESDAQDIANLLNTIKGQQFTKEIQYMRNNNKTGGAVGNVSDREVSMFQNMAANLDYSGSKEELWYQLNLLYKQGKKVTDVYADNFSKYYGEDNAKRYGMSNYRLTLKDYDEDFNNALSVKKTGEVEKRFEESKSELPRVNSLADVDALPRGTVFIDPNGKKRIKR